MLAQKLVKIETGSIGFRGVRVLDGFLMAVRFEDLNRIFLLDRLRQFTNLCYGKASSGPLT